MIITKKNKYHIFEFCLIFTLMTIFTSPFALFDKYIISIIINILFSLIPFFLRRFGFKSIQINYNWFQTETNTKK